MQPARPPPRAPGSFSPLLSGTQPQQDQLSTPEPPRPRARRVDSPSSDDSNSIAALRSSRAQSLQRPSTPQTPLSATPIYASFTSQPNSSTTSLQNFSRPSALSPAAAAAARSVAASHDLPRGSSPLTLPPAVSAASTASSPRSYQATRKHALTAPGLFEASLPSASASAANPPHIGAMAAPRAAPLNRELSASHIAAQAAVMHHQNRDQQQQQPQQQNNHYAHQQQNHNQLSQQQQDQQQQRPQQQQQPQQQHNRQRSQTVPAPGEDYSYHPPNPKRGSGGPLSPPMLSLTEASAPKETVFGGGSSFHSGMTATAPSAAAQAAANVVFPRATSQPPGQAQASQAAPKPPPPAPPLPPPKSKVKLFSRPGKIYTKSETKEKPQPSPGKIGAALSSLQRGNFSTTSLDSTAQSFYSLANSSSATIRAAVDTPPESGEKDKEKKHHFLSRQKHKLKDKDEYHLPLSSARSNSRPTDPNAPSSLYSFNVPASPGPGSTTFRGMSGLDLRHGGRALREKRKEEQQQQYQHQQQQQHQHADSAGLPVAAAADWPGPGSLGSVAGQSSLYLHDTVDSGKLGLNSIAMEDAWPYLRAKLLVIFEGEDLRPPIEELNRVVTMHIQYTIARRLPNVIVEDVRDLLGTGFGSLDQALRKTPEDRLIPALVELWIFTFTTILPYMQAVFLPLDLEFAGAGSLMTPEQARDFWGGVLAARPPPPQQAEAAAAAAASSSSSAPPPPTEGKSPVNLSPASAVLDIRRMVLTAFRDRVVLPRYDTLKAMFSRLSLEFLPQSLASMALASPLPIPYKQQQQQQDPGLGGSGGGGQAAGAAQFSTSPSGDSAGSFSYNSMSQSTSFLPRPGTAASLDPAMASYNSTGSTLLGDMPFAAAGAVTGGSRSRAISNVSHGSDGGASSMQGGGGGGGGGGLLRPFTPSGPQAHRGGGGPSALAASLASLRDQNVEDSKQVTEMVGRMLQCMSVLSGVGVAGGDAGDEDKRVAELCRLLKLNWLGRGRTGRNRRGMVGGRVRRGADVLGAGLGYAATVREEVSVP